MKDRKSKYEEKGEKFKGSESIKSKNKKRMKRNMKRLGGGGLSLEFFANAKSKNEFYNPALLKKQREIYNNAKKVNKYKKLVKQQGQRHDISSAINPIKDENETEYGSIISNDDKNSKNHGVPSLKEMYEKKHERKGRERIEMEAHNQAKKEEREKAEARRKAAREKMFKKTQAGQPVMKYRIEHLLETYKHKFRFQK